MSEPPLPYREPLRATLLRTLTIAAIAAAALVLGRGGLARWPVAFVVMLWPALGGHYVELAFLNGLRPRLPDSRYLQAVVRLGVWFAGGVVLMFAMKVTGFALALIQGHAWPEWWVGGIAFAAIELVVHSALQMLGRPSFFNGRG
jgi:hypothetical protein